MKRNSFMLALAVSWAVSAAAGTSYKFESTTSGKPPSKLAGTVRVEGTNMRVDMTRGDGTVFRDNAILLSRDGGKTLVIVDPAKKTYTELRLDDLAGGEMMQQLGGMLQFDVENEKVRTRDAGAGGVIEGFTTRRSIVESSYDLVMMVFGSETRMKMSSTIESWTTDKLPAQLANVFQLKNLRTGIPAVDKLIAAQHSTPRGFPLKQVATTRVTVNGDTTTSTTTTTVSQIRQVTIPAKEFAVPAGYRRTGR